MTRLALLFAIALAAVPATSQPEQSGAGSAEDGAGPAGTLVFVSGSNRLTAIDAASGRRTVRRVGSVAQCGPELHATGGHVIFAGLRRRWTVVYSLPLSLEGRLRRLGRAHAFVPSATAGRVWLAGVDCNRSRMVGVREVAVDGTETAASPRRVPKGWLAGAVGSGLVIQRGRRPQIWHLGTGRTSAPLPLDGVEDIRGTLLVSCALRSRCRRLSILDSASRRSVAVRPPRGQRVGGPAAFSPDASRLAVPLVSKRRWSVALVNTRSGRAATVPGSHTGRHYPHVGWSQSSGWLFFAAGGRRVKAYLPGRPRAVTLPFRISRAPSFAVG
jgi:hypothetical protein